MIAIEYVGKTYLILYRDFGSTYRNVDKGWFVAFNENERENIRRFLEVSELKKGDIRQFPILY